MIDEFLGLRFNLQLFADGEDGGAGGTEEEEQEEEVHTALELEQAQTIAAQAEEIKKLKKINKDLYISNGGGEGGAPDPEKTPEEQLDDRIVAWVSSGYNAAELNK